MRYRVVDNLGHFTLELHVTVNGSGSVMPLQVRRTLLIVVVLSIALAAQDTAQYAESGPVHSVDAGDKRKKRKKLGSSLKDFGKQSEEAAPGLVDARRLDSNTEEPGALRLKALLVVFDVLVTDPATSRSVPNLAKEDFVLAEEGQPQEISVFTRGHDANLPRSIVLIIDYSGSQFAYLETSIEAAKMLVTQLGPSDEMAIVTDDVKLLVDYTSDKARLIKAVDSLLKRAKREKELGDSLQFTAIFAVLRELVDRDQTRPIIIFQTDGDEAPALHDQPDAERFAFLYRKETVRNYGLEDIYDAVRRSRATVYSVIPGDRLVGIPDDQRYDRGREVLQKRARAWNLQWNRPQHSGRTRFSDYQVKLFTDLFVKGQEAVSIVADVGGGWTAFLERPEQAGEIYSAILADINERYVLAYYPTNTHWDGSLRNVRIEVRGHPELKVHGRTNYYAPTDKR